MPAPEELADFVAERAKKDPKVQKVIHEAAMFDGLTEHVGWRRLHTRVLQARDAWMRELAKRLMSGNKVPPEEIAYKRGFYFGARWIIEHPAEAMNALESAAAAAWAMAQIEMDKQAEESSPYIDDPQEG